MAAKDVFRFASETLIAAQGEWPKQRLDSAVYLGVTTTGR